MEDRFHTSVTKILSDDTLTNGEREAIAEAVAVVEKHLQSHYLVVTLVPSEEALASDATSRAPESFRTALKP
jgi:hypothetical protein